MNRKANVLKAAKKTAAPDISEKVKAALQLDQDETFLSQGQYFAEVISPERVSALLNSARLPDNWGGRDEQRCDMLSQKLFWSQGRIESLLGNSFSGRKVL